MTFLKTILTTALLLIIPQVLTGISAGAGLRWSPLLGYFIVLTAALVWIGYKVDDLLWEMKKHRPETEVPAQA